MFSLPIWPPDLFAMCRSRRVTRRSVEKRNAPTGAMPTDDTFTRAATERIHLKAAMDNLQDTVCATELRHNLACVFVLRSGLKVCSRTNTQTAQRRRARLHGTYVNIPSLHICTFSSYLWTMTKYCQTPLCSRVRGRVAGCITIAALFHMQPVISRQNSVTCKPETLVAGIETV